MRKHAGYIYLLAGLIAALGGALESMGRVRLVDVLTLFFGGFGAGAGLTKTIADMRKAKRDNTSAS